MSSSHPRRLLQGRRGPNATASPSTTTPSRPSSTRDRRSDRADREADSSLPEYVQPSFPLNDSARRALAELVSSNRVTPSLIAHLGKCASAMTYSAADLIEASQVNRKQLQSLEARIAKDHATPVAAAMTDENNGEDGDENTPSLAPRGAAARALEPMKKHVIRLEKDADELGPRLEKEVRGIVDWQAEIEDDDKTMTEIKDAITMRRDTQVVPCTDSSTEIPEQRRRKRQRQQPQDGEDESELEPRRRPKNDNRANDDDDDNDGEASGEQKQHDDSNDDDASRTRVKGIPEMYKEERERKAEAYRNLSAREKYAMNNTYIGFKNQWHTALHGDDIPLPNASRWFTADGRPISGKETSSNNAENNAHSNDNNNAADDEDDDEDLVVASEKVSLKCPLSLAVMTEPYTTRQCKHTFDKVSIMGYFQRQSRVRCPQTGCSQTFTKSDLYLDEPMLRRIQKAKQAEEQRRRDEAAAEDDDEDANDTTLNVGDESRVLVTRESPVRNVVKREMPNGRKASRRVVDDDDDGDG